VETFEPLRTRAEHARVHRGFTALFRHAGAESVKVRLQEGAMRSWYLPAHEIWLAAHELPNRYRNALGTGAPPRGVVWPSVQLNLPLEPGSSRPNARFLRDSRGNYCIGHTGQLGGRVTGISRQGFIDFLGGETRTREIAVGENRERLVMLGTFAKPSALVEAIAELAHAAHAYRGAIASGLR